MNELLKTLAKKSAAAVKRNDNDYEKDGLLYCGNCHSRKQGWRVFPDGSRRKVSCLCICETKAYDEEQQRLKEEQKALRIKQLRVNGIQDKSLRDATFANARPMPMIDKALRYVERWDEMRADNIGLLMWGNTGNGKTYAAACIANALIDKGVPVLITSFGRILSAITGLFAEERVAYMDSLNEFPLLILDDLGAERQSQFALETVYSVIDNRYKARLPLIVTTNCTMQELKNAANMDYQRIYDRVLEMCVPLQFTGESLRKDAAAAKMARARELFK